MKLKNEVNEKNNIMENKKPKFKIGDKIRVMSLEEANKISYNVESNKALTKYLGKNFTVTGLRLIGGMYYYFLKEKAGVCVQECLLDYPYGHFSYPQNPQYSVGDYVVIKKEKDLRETFSSELWWLKDLLPVALGILHIERSYWFCDQNIYEAEVKPGVYIKIPEKAILKETDSKSYIAVSQNSTRNTFPKEDPDKGEDSISSLEEWRTMYIDMLNFISTASPKTKAFIAGHLHGLVEKLMNETLKEE